MTSNLIHHLDDLTPSLLSFISSFPLTNASSARAWCIVFKLLLLSDPLDLITSNDLLHVFAIALSSPQEIQQILNSNFNSLITKLIELKESNNLQKGLLN